MDNLFFVASKTLGMAARAETWILLLMALCLVSIWRGGRGALAWGGAAFAATLALTLFPLGDLLLAPLERQYPARPALTSVDGIIVLGGAERTGVWRRWGGVQTDEGGERFTEAVMLSRRFPQALLIFTGGEAGLGYAGDTSGPSQVARLIWTELGVDPARIVTEERSRNTVENAHFTHDLIQPGPDQHYVLVTSAFHMPRAVASFARAGWGNVTPWPVDFRSGELFDGARWRLDGGLFGLDVALKEYLGLFVYKMTGR